MLVFVTNDKGNFIIDKKRKKNNKTYVFGFRLKYP